MHLTLFANILHITVVKVLIFHTLDSS